jgi:EAL domain-containing protein (putative c-di-GMP-specific phosphodiesterase class I)
MLQSRIGETAPLQVGAAFRARPGDLSRLVRDALADGRVTKEFQPIVMADAPSCRTLQAGFLRLIYPEGHVLRTGPLRGAVAESTLGRDLDTLTLREGLQALRRHAGLRLAVHASARSLGNAAWRATLEEGLRAIGPRLVLVMEEGSATILADRVARAMAELRPHGVSFVLDDFGNGPPSLRQLQEIRFAGVKIDHPLVRDVDASPERQALIGALISVAHRFGMFAVAKGVESEAEAAQLRALGVDGLQGALFGPPGPLIDCNEA